MFFKMVITASYECHDLIRMQTNLHIFIHNLFFYIVMFLCCYVDSTELKQRELQLLPKVTLKWSR